MLAAGITGLHNEVSDHPVEQEAVVEVTADKLQEVVTVRRGLVVKFYAYVACRGLQHYGLAPGGMDKGCRHTNKKE